MRVRTRFNLGVRQGARAAGRQALRSVTHWRHLVATIVLLILVLAVLEILFGLVQAGLRAFIRSVQTAPENLSLHLIQAPAWAGVALGLGLVFLGVVGAWLAIQALSRYERPP